ncbi:MAG TPA: CoA transferase, partial [Dehalococcoidia bacterium]|nr:CoA transferase [Dehalococcoidia bacterium]
MTDRPIGPGPLAGLRVLDLTQERGALATKQLAELGAEVVLIEPPEGHTHRSVGPFLDDQPGPDRSLTFAFYHAGHRSIVADLATRAGQERVRSLAAGADLLIEDRAPGELAGCGLGYEDLKTINPRLIHVALSAFGQTGPRRDWRATDLIAWAAGGPMSVTGPPAGPPLRAAGNQADQMGALWAIIGALAALIARDWTGQGQMIDISLQEAVILAGDTVGFTAIYTGRPARRRGSEHVSLVPQRIMRARDGYLMMAIVTQGQWQDFLGWLREEGAAEPLERPEWQTYLGRLRDREAIHALIAEWVATQDRFPLMAEAQRRGLPIAALSTPADVVADPHLADRGFWVDQSVGGRTLPVPAGPYRSSTGLPRLGTAPEMGGQQVGWAASSRHRRQRERPAGGHGVKSDRPADTHSPAHRAGPLAGIRVLDFGWMIAGAFAAGILGDLGADVIKVEPREVGDPFRGIPPFAHKEVGPNTSGAFNLYNRNKRGVTIDVRRPEGRDLARRLAAWADVIVENWSAGTFERLELDEATLRAANPRLVWVRMAGFGQTGPHRHYVSVAPTLMAATGLTYLTGP